jgi:predicted dehydrogenase
MVVLVHGTGSIGTRHLRVLERMGVPARGLSVRAADSASYEGVAIIATSTGRHLADATAALRAGCHVLVEKPLAASAAGVAELERVAREVDRRVYVGCCLRFDAALLHFRSLLPQIGKVREVRVECQSYLPDWRPGTDYRASYSAKRDEGGVLRDLIHEIDYSAWLFGWPAQLVARVGNTGALGIESEEWADLEWTADDTRVSIRLDYLTKPARRIVRAHGEHGIVEVDLIAHRLTFGADITEVDQERDDMMRDQARAFFAAIDGGDARQLATLEDGARALAICDAARASNGALVGVPDWRTG